jgi:hypothetical protein
MVLPASSARLSYVLLDTEVAATLTAQALVTFVWQQQKRRTTTARCARRSNAMRRSAGPLICSAAAEVQIRRVLLSQVGCVATLAFTLQELPSFLAWRFELTAA